MQITCPECGKPYDDDQCCWFCEARYEAIQQTFIVSLLVGLGGVIGNVIAVFSYPPLGGCWWLVYVIGALFAVPAAITFALYNADQLTPCATFVRVMLALAATTIVILAAYFFLNGFLDANPPVEAQALVLQKFIISDRHGVSHYLQLDLSWDGKKVENNDFIAGPNTYSLSEPGDYVRVVVHPGRFSLPWYDGVLPPVSRESSAR